MNIIDIKTYPKYLLLLGVVLLSASCHREDPVEQEHLGIPIQLAADTHWPDLTKGTDDLIKDEKDFDGFVVWANVEWDNSNSISVFGGNGTKVYSPNWDYKPAQYWQMGTYNFAAVLPASVFSATNFSPEDNSIGTYKGEHTVDDNGNSFLYFDFDDGFDLSQTQTDLMVAFQTAEITEDQYSAIMSGVTDDAPGPVELNFYHQLSLLNFTIRNKIEVEGTSFTPSINIKNIKIYGNHTTATSATSTPTIGQDEDGNDIIVSTTDFKFVDDSESNRGAPYYEFDVEDGISIENGKSHNIQDLLVFPESCNLTVEVTYTEEVNNIETSETITKSATLSNCTWSPGTKYTYSLNISRSEIIFFGEPTVEEWGYGGSAGNIEIK